LSWSESESEFDRSAVVVGLGAVTPIGRSALTSAAAVRAGISGFSQHAFMVDAAGEPMRIAQCSWLAAEPNIANHILHCLTTAIQQSLVMLADAAVEVPLTLFINLPLARPGLPEMIATTVQEEIVRSFAGVFSRIAVAQVGHAGGLLAMQSALRTLATNPAAACVIAGGDSYLDPDTLEWLEETEQLHGAGERNNAWGFVPGEAAGAVLLMTADRARTLGLPPLARVVAVGNARETHLNRSGQVCIGEGLTSAIRLATEGYGSGHCLTDVYCDMNGDPYRADEFAFTVTRVRERFVAASDFMAPADCWGDVGAASALLYVALASIASLKGYARGNDALVWCSSDSGERAAAAIVTAARGP